MDLTVFKYNFIYKKKGGGADLVNRPSFAAPALDF